MGDLFLERRKIQFWLMFPSAGRSKDIFWWGIFRSEHYELWLHPETWTRTQHEGATKVVSCWAVGIPDRETELKSTAAHGFPELISLCPGLQSTLSANPRTGIYTIAFIP